MQVTHLQMLQAPPAGARKLETSHLFMRRAIFRTSLQNRTQYFIQERKKLPKYKQVKQKHSNQPLTESIQTTFLPIPRTRFYFTYASDVG